MRATGFSRAGQYWSAVPVVVVLVSMVAVRASVGGPQQPAAQAPADADAAVAARATPGADHVIDVRIEGARRSVLLRDGSGRVLRDLSGAPFAPSLGHATTSRRQDVRHIRIVGGGPGDPYEPTGSDDPPALPGGYDPSRDPYVQYPELLDPNYYLSNPE
jgi:hypothetical protein